MTLSCPTAPDMIQHGHLFDRKLIELRAMAALISSVIGPANAMAERAAADFLAELIAARLARLMPVTDGPQPKTALSMYGVAGLIDGPVTGWAQQNAMRLLSDWRNEALKLTGWKITT